jgi:hypothetical protein
VGRLETAEDASDWLAVPEPDRYAVSHMLRHTFVTTMLDADVDLRDVQIAARYADPRTTMRYDRARQNLDPHPNCILAAFIASGTWPQPASPAAPDRGRRTELPMSANPAAGLVSLKLEPR